MAVLENFPCRINGSCSEIDSDRPAEVMRSILTHLTVGSGDKEFAKLYTKLIEPPFGIPNGIIPIFLALVFRTEGSRIGVYEKGRQMTAQPTLSCMRRSSGWPRILELSLHAILGCQVASVSFSGLLAL